jgi:short-subunit dehydrogenase
MDKVVVLVTGSSSGIGLAAAEYLHMKGYRVYGASRYGKEKNSYGFIHIQMDVNDNNSVNQAIDHIKFVEGRIDVLINCAGYGFAGPVEETSEEEIISQFNTNFFGIFRLCKAILPFMRERNSGTIINISSLAGISSLPFQGFYSASKFALEGMSEALRMEISEFGIHVVLIEPGNYNTQFTQNRKKTFTGENSVYKKSFNNALQIIENEEQNGPNPEKIAHLILKIIRNSKPRLRYKTGPLKERYFISLKNILPYSLYEYLLKLHYRLIHN